MTIIFNGHVEAIKTPNNPRAACRLRLRIASERACDPIEVDAFGGEADAYKVGGGIECRIIPVSLENTYITGYEAAYREIAETLGFKGELWTTGSVVEAVRNLKRRSDALREAVG